MEKIVKRCLNNKGSIIFCIILIVFCSVLNAVCYLMNPDKAYSGPYLNSAHGNSSYGVNRSSISSFGYSKGNCVHCHEQHAGIGGFEPNPTGGPDEYCLLENNFSGISSKPYSQSDNVCFYCHIGTGILQTPAFYNYNYSITFGGHNDIAPNNIFDAFNNTSYHNLNDIWRLITGQYGSKTFTNFPSDSNPCSGCHNIHIAKKSCGKPSGSFDANKSAISKPSDHGNLWGDDDPSERMTAAGYGSNYQPPRYYNSSNLEPDGAGSDRTTQAGKTPDYVTFCTDCHISTANSVWSTTLGRWLRPIDWNNEKHGKGNADDSLSCDNPYPSNGSGLGKVLSCLDCHEPHGSPNLTLIRKVVNGATLGTITTIDPFVPPSCSTYSNYDATKSSSVANLCDRCHKDDYDFSASCQNDHWYIVHHDNASGDPFYTGGMCGDCHAIGNGPNDCSSGRPSINCNCCHYHGSTYTRGTTTWRTF